MLEIPIAVLSAVVPTNNSIFQRLENEKIDQLYGQKLTQGMYLFGSGFLFGRTPPVDVEASERTCQL